MILTTSILEYDDGTFEVSQKEESKRSSAEQILYHVAKEAGNPRLATLATRMRLDGFTKVIEEIDGMVRQPQSQWADALSISPRAAVDRSYLYYTIARLYSTVIRCNSAQCSRFPENTY